MNARRPMKAAAMVVLLLIVFLALIGCGGAGRPVPSASALSLSGSSLSGSLPSGSLPSVLAPGSVRPSGVSSAPALPVNQTNASAVALAGVKALNQSDTVIDADPNATARRAIAWLASAFAAQVRAFAPVAAPGAQWNTWARHRAYLAVRTSPGQEDHPVDSPSRAFRQVVVVITPIGRDGWKGARITEVVYVALERVDGVWRIASTHSG